MNKRPNLWLTLLIFSAAPCLRADIIPEALLSFPAQTEYVEYDNLASLRTLADYNTLRQRFSGKPLDEAKIVLGQLGIQEDQVDEMVTGAHSAAFYGLLSGTFSGQAAAKTARKKGFASKDSAGQMFCTGRATCILFLEDSLAAFGTVSRLKDMLAARQGAQTRLGSNRDFVALLNGSERRAPVRGVLCGTQLKTDVSEILRDWTGWKRDWSTLSANVSALGYSVRLDKQAHVSATLECTSRTAAAVLLQMLSAVGALQSATSSAKTNADTPFENLHVSSSGSVVYFKADTDLVNGSR